jgi:hypothetical protein
MCCGSKRSASRNTSTPSRAPSTTPLVPQHASERAHIPGAPGRNPAATRASISPRASFLPVTLEYLETAAIRVWGPVTGRQYDFSGAQPAQGLDPRDAAALARSGLFRRA